MSGGIGGAARTTPDAPALVTMSGVVSFLELNERGKAVVSGLQDAGLSAGDRVGVLSLNRREVLEVTTAMLRAGLVPVPISPLAAPAEVAYVIEDSGCRWMFADRPIEVGPTVAGSVTFGDAFERFVHDHAGAEVELSDHVLGRPFHYTSGTSGRPKGVWVPRARPGQAAALSEGFRQEWGLKEDEVHMVCSPLTHSAPHRFAVRTLEAGGRVYLLPRFEPADALATIELLGVTSTFMVPTHLERIFSLEERILRRHDLSSLRLLVHAGAAVRPETKQRAIELFPPGSVWEFYGATEGFGTRISSDEWVTHPGSVGTPRARAKISIKDDEGQQLTTGEVGRVWIEDPVAEPFEYWGDPERTRRARERSAFTVGDLGWLDADGYLFLAGRADDVIITGGVNVNPREVELVLMDHPGVDEAVVYGAPDDEWGQIVHAAVVPAFGSPLDAELLRAWARARMSGPKCPKVIEIVDELPKTPTGKVRRAHS
ncbi:MAG TPA: AMP-binding protein [Actinomycetota bacterium]|nr:AMP-binding protein [Actinomycetota bacterium]